MQLSAKKLLKALAYNETDLGEYEKIQRIKKCIMLQKIHNQSSQLNEIFGGKK